MTSSPTYCLVFRAKLGGLQVDAPPPDGHMLLLEAYVTIYHLYASHGMWDTTLQHHGGGLELKILQFSLQKTCQK